jgi:hypothetical protein
METVGSDFQQGPPASHERGRRGTRTWRGRSAAPGVEQIGSVIEQAAAESFQLGVTHLAFLAREKPEGPKVPNRLACDSDGRFLVRWEIVHFFPKC